MFCLRCHRKTELQQWMPQIKLCKGCNFRLSEMLNFLEHFGYGVQLLLPENDGGPMPITEAEGLQNGRTATARAPTKA